MVPIQGCPRLHQPSIFTKKALEQWANLPEEQKNTRAEKQLTKKLSQLLELIEKAIASKEKSRPKAENEVGSDS